jgi:hypothetical protein
MKNVWRDAAAAPAPGEDVLAPFSDEPDETLVDEMLRLSISDRLRMISRTVNALGRLRRV